MTFDFLNRKYNKHSKKLVTQSFKEILRVFEGLGADIDIGRSSNVLGFMYKIYNKGGDVVLKKNIYNFREMLEVLGRLYPIKVVPNSSHKLGSVYSICFNTDISALLIKEVANEPQGSQEEENCSYRTSEVSEKSDQEDQTETGNESGAPDMGSTIQESPTGLDLEQVVEPEPTPETMEELGEPNWVSLSSPTFGKKNLVSLAEKHGIILDPKMKYQDLVTEFSTKFEQKD